MKCSTFPQQQSGNTEGSLHDMVIDYLSDSGLRRIPCYTLLHCTEVLSFNCGLSVAKYLHRSSAMQN